MEKRSANKDGDEGGKQKSIDGKTRLDKGKPRSTGQKSEAKLAHRRLFDVYPRPSSNVSRSIDHSNPAVYAKNITFANRPTDSCKNKMLLSEWP
jgi:hypothetical protein